MKIFSIKKPIADPDAHPTEQAIFGGEEHRAQMERIDLSVEVADTKIVKRKFTESPIFNQFKSWLPSSSPIKKEEQKKKSKDHTPIEFIRETWGPGSKKK